MTREELKMAFDEAMSYEFSFIENMPEHQFSVQFERRMRKIMRKANRKNGIFNLSAAIPRNFPAMAAAFIIICMCTMQIHAISEPIIKLINNIYEKFNLITFNDHSTIDYIACEYELTYVPDSFTLTNSDKNTTFLFYNYVNDNGNIIRFAQNVIKDDSKIHFDNENGTLSYLTISDMDIILYKSDFCLIAAWIQDNYYMTLSWAGEYNEADFIKIIKSVRSVETSSAGTTTNSIIAE